MDHFWLPSASKQPLPRFAIQGGHARNGKPQYVGRCFHEGDFLPAVIEPDSESALVSWAGRGHIKDEYEILLGPGYGWTPWQHGGVPRNAVSSGVCSRGEPLYIGRGHYNGTLSVGKVHASHDCLYIPYGSDEVRISDYEVLVKAPDDTWLRQSLESPPPSDAVKAHNEQNDFPIYVARAEHEGLSLPVTFVPERQKALMVTEGLKVIKKTEIEVLCGSNYTWLEPCHNDIPANAVFTGRRGNGEPLIVGRAWYKNHLVCGLVADDGSFISLPVGEKAVRVDNYETLIRHQP